MTADKTPELIRKLRKWAERWPEEINTVDLILQAATALEEGIEAVEKLEFDLDSMTTIVQELAAILAEIDAAEPDLLSLEQQYAYIRAARDTRPITQDVES